MSFDTHPAASKPRIFVSYGHKDAADFLALAKRDLGGDYELVLDEEFMRASYEWTDQLEDAIRTSSLLLAVMSPNSVRRDADAADRRDSICHKELHLAFTQGINILPIMWKRCAPPFLINDVHFIDFELFGYERALDHLKAALADAIAGKPIPHAYGIRADWSLANWFAPILAERSTFYGRKWLLQEVYTWRRKAGPARLLLITGSTGAGKSSFLTQLKTIREPAG